MKTITQLFFLFAITAVGYAQEVTVSYLDFGGPDNQTEDINYNNIVTTEEEQEVTAQLIDSEGEDTGITLTIDDVFHGVNSGGASTPDEELGFPASATGDSFYGEESEFDGFEQPTGGFTLSGLNPEAVYSFSIFASRATDGSDSRETLYTIVGLDGEEMTATLETVNNTSETAEIMEVQPTAEGTITFTAEPGPNNTNGNGFYYLGAIEMTATTNLSVNEAALNNSLAVYPNPVSTRAQISFDLKEKTQLKIGVYDLSGRLVENVVNGEQPAGNFSTTWNRSSNLSSGLYILQIDADGKHFNSKLLLK